MKRLATSLIACLIATLGTAHAADAVTDALQSAYAPYRVALFKTNSKAQADSEAAIAQAQQAMKRVIEQHAAKPPAPYDRDAAFGATLDKVTATYAQAEREIRQGQLPQAHETLEVVRDLLADLRQRNGVVVFSDHMNAYHEVMEHVLQAAAGTTRSPTELQDLSWQAGTLEYLATRLRHHAPPALRNDPDFTAGVQAVEASVKAVREAARAGDLTTLRAAIGKLKAPYSRLFLKFG